MLLDKKEREGKLQPSDLFETEIEVIKNAKATASTFGSRMQTAIGDADKAVTELNSTALTGLADGFARAVSYGEDFGDCLKSLVQDITYTITKMLMLKAITAMFGGLFGGVSGGNVYDAVSMGWQTLMGDGWHSGGVIGADSATFTRAIPRFHTGGIVGSNEQLAVLKKGEGVFTRGQMSALGANMSSNTNNTAVYVTVNNSGGGDMSNEQAAALGEQINKAVEVKVAETMYKYQRSRLSFAY